MTNICISHNIMTEETHITNHKDREESEISVNSNYILHTSVEHT